MKTSQLDPRDYKYIVENGDPGFNPAYNKWAVDQVFKETNERIMRGENEWREPFFERAKAVEAYLKSPRGAEAGNSVERYFGRSVMAELIGDGIKKTIQSKISPELWQKAANTRPTVTTKSKKR